MKIGFICPPASGHFNPMSSLARQLQSRNYDVVMISMPTIEPLARGANLPFVSFGEEDFPPDRFAEAVRIMSRSTGEQGLKFSVYGIAAVTALKWKTFPKLLSSTGIDGVVLDNYEFYGEVVPIRLGMPYAILSSALHFDYSGCTPLCQSLLLKRVPRKPPRDFKIERHRTGAPIRTGTTGFPLYPTCARAVARLHIRKCFQQQTKNSLP